MTDQQRPVDAPTIREIYALLQTLRDHIDQSFTRHELEHEQEADKRRSLILWALTSCMAGVGVVVAIYTASKP